MRIHRIRLRDFRGVRDRAVSFEPSGVTIVEGANEAGKTSMAEALDLLLELPDSSKDKRVGAVKPVHADAGPEVEAEITTGDYRLVYRKRWLKDRMTELTVEAPRREQLAGRDAHDRVRAILDETLDRGLWRALRIEQDKPVEQAALGANNSLAAALDAASAGTLGGDAEASLYERVEREYLTYFTRTGRQGKEYREAAEALAPVRQRAEDAQRALADAERDIDRHAQLTRELGLLDTERREHALRLAEAERQWQALEAERRELDALAARADGAVQAADAAADALIRRRELARDVEDGRRKLADLLGDDERHRPALAQARERATAARRGLDELRMERVRAEERVRRAAARLDYQRDQRDLRSLLERQRQADEALGVLEEAERALATCRVDDERLAEIEKAHLDVERARAVLAASSPTLTLEALSQREVWTDDRPRPMAAGETLEHTVTGPVELVVPDVVRVRVVPGERTAADAARWAEEDLRERCERVGVHGVHEARERARARHEASRRQAEAAKDLERARHGSSAEQIAQEVARLRARLDAYESGRADESGPPPDMAAVEEAHDAARSAADDAARRADDAERELRRLEDEVSHLREEAHVREATIAASREELHRAEARLGAARAQEPDGALERRLARTRAEADGAERERDRKTAEIAEQDPEALEAVLANARDRARRFDADLRRLEEERYRLDERLSLASGQGLADRLDDALSAREAHERQYERYARRAEAARLLFETMRRHREEAKRSYVAPFRGRVESLGRIVFGQDLAVDVDEELRVTSRTLGGRTVPYEGLSMGAREQLCIISRLACAQLVNTDEGVPVVVDDALGHSDPERLDRLGAVFNAAGRHAQVIVLTCVPGRYRGIGSAKVVRLDTCA